MILRMAKKTAPDCQESANEATKIKKFGDRRQLAHGKRTYTQISSPTGNLDILIGEMERTCNSFFNNHFTQVDACWGGNQGQSL